MIKVTLGKTNITVNKNGFGALPIQRISKEEAGKLLRKAYDNGVQYFDTARAYTDSEEKIGYALSDVRDKIYLATKSKALTPEELRKDFSLTKFDIIKDVKLFYKEYKDYISSQIAQSIAKRLDGTILKVIEDKNAELLQNFIDLHDTIGQIFNNINWNFSTDFYERRAIC